MVGPCWPRRLLAVLPVAVRRAVRVLIAGLPVLAIRIHNYGWYLLDVGTAIASLRSRFESISAKGRKNEGRQECLPITPIPIL